MRRWTGGNELSIQRTLSYIVPENVRAGWRTCWWGPMQGRTSGTGGTSGTSWTRSGWTSGTRTAGTNPQHAA